MRNLIRYNNRDVALKLLEETALYYKSVNSENVFAIQSSRQASVLLGFNKLSKQFTNRLKTIDYHPLRGAITNIKKSDISKDAFKLNLLTKKQILSKYPRFSENSLQEINDRYFGSMNHVSLCFDGKFQDALKFANKQVSKSDRELFELEALSTIALTGNPSLALELSEHAARKDELSIILVIE